MLLPSLLIFDDGMELKIFLIGGGKGAHPNNQPKPYDQHSVCFKVPFSDYIRYYLSNLEALVNAPPPLQWYVACGWP